MSEFQFIVSGIANGDLSVLQVWCNEPNRDLDLPIGMGDDAGLNLLHLCVRAAQIELASWLLNQRILVNVNAQTALAEAPLHFAVGIVDEKVALAMIDLLLSHGAELNGKRRDGKTALHLAIGLKSVKLCEKLVTEGADPYLLDGSGVSAMQQLNLFLSGDPSMPREISKLEKLKGILKQVRN